MITNVLLILCALCTVILSTSWNGPQPIEISFGELNDGATVIIAEESSWGSTEKEDAPDVICRFPYGLSDSVFFETLPFTGNGYPKGRCKWEVQHTQGYIQFKRPSTNYRMKQKAGENYVKLYSGSGDTSRWEYSNPGRVKNQDSETCLTATAINTWIQTANCGSSKRWTFLDISGTPKPTPAPVPTAPTDTMK